jgi:23S rRNA (uracil1939-C5)-methyltransferase
MRTGKVLENICPDSIHSGGRTKATVDNRNIFIDYTLPGETVDVCLQRRQMGFRLATVVNIKKASEYRVAPFCKHYGVCGGCNWQHISYEYQLYLKRQILLNALLKYNIEHPFLPNVVPSPQLQYYRNKTEYAFTNKSWTPDLHTENTLAESRGLGFHPTDRSAGVIDITECYLQGFPERQIIDAVKQIAISNNFEFYDYFHRKGWLRNIIVRTTTIGQCMVILGIMHADEQKINTLFGQLVQKIECITSLHYTIITHIEKGFSDGELVSFTNTQRIIFEQLGHLKYQISPRAFFQPNPLQAANFYNTILQWGNFNGKELVYDLYTGAGTIACYIAKSVRKVIGIEGSAEAIADACENAQNNGITNAQFIVGDILQTFTPAFVEQHGQPQLIILDPPRSGTLMEIKKTIIAARPAKVIYVSCNPVSLAWDLKLLTEAYKIVAIQPFDQFPHTHHVETVVLLEQRGVGNT